MLLFLNSRMGDDISYIVISLVQQMQRRTAHRKVHWTDVLIGEKLDEIETSTHRTTTTTSIFLRNHLRTKQHRRGYKRPKLGRQEHAYSWQMVLTCTNQFDPECARRVCVCVLHASSKFKNFPKKERRKHSRFQQQRQPNFYWFSRSQLPNIYIRQCALFLCASYHRHYILGCHSLFFRISFPNYFIGAHGPYIPPSALFRPSNIEHLRIGGHRTDECIACVGRVKYISIAYIPAAVAYKNTTNALIPKPIHRSSFFHAFVRLSYLPTFFSRVFWHSFCRRHAFRSAYYTYGTCATYSALPTYIFLFSSLRLCHFCASFFVYVSSVGPVM